MSRYTRCPECKRWFFGRHGTDGRFVALRDHMKDKHGREPDASEAKDYSAADRRQIERAERPPRTDDDIPDGAWYAMNRREIEAALQEAQP